MMTEMTYKIGSLNGYTEEIGHLVSMLTYVRSTTIKMVNDLTVEELDFLFSQSTNSIGALLLHIASGEYLIRIRTFENRQLHEEEWNSWEPALLLGDLGRKSIKNNGIEYYLKQLNEQRQETLRLFKTVNDSWLYEELKMDRKPKNKYFNWFEVLEDELHHRGQISMIMKNLLSKK